MALKDLAAEGWSRRSVASEPRLSEVARMYESLGFEVLLVPVLQDCGSDGGAGRCTDCFEGDADPDRYQVIYTRPGAAAPSEGEAFDGG